MSWGINNINLVITVMNSCLFGCNRNAALVLLVTAVHEAKIGRIPDENIYYLMTRGLSEEDAKAMLVRGFAEPISKELPLEYAVEMNRLIDLEFEGSIG